jgi:hypothetical protein
MQPGDPRFDGRVSVVGEGPPEAIELRFATGTHRAERVTEIPPVAEPTEVDPEAGS